MEWLSSLLKLALLITTLAVLAGFMAPRSILSIAAISLKPSLVAASLFLAIALLATGAPWAASFALTLALLGAAFLLPYYRSSPTIEDPDTTIVWANIFGREASLQKAVALADELGADFLLLAEVPPSSSIPDGWSARSDHRPVFVLSRLPGQTAKRIGDESVATVQLSEPDYDVFGTHMTMPLLQGGPRRRADELALLALSVEDRPTIIVGDFNTVPWSTAFHELEDQKQLRRLDIGAKTTWLSPLLFLGLPIDHALVSADLRASAEVGPSIGSDHRPLIVRVRREK